MFSAEVVLHRYSLAQIFEDPETTLQDLAALTNLKKPVSLTKEICTRNCSSGQPRVLSGRGYTRTLPGKHEQPRDRQHELNPAYYNESDNEPSQQYFRDEQPDVPICEDHQYVEDSSVYAQHEPRYTGLSQVQQHSYSHYDQYQYGEQHGMGYQRPQDEACSDFSDFERRIGNDDDYHHSASTSQQFPQKRNARVAFAHDSKGQSPEMGVYDDGYESFSPGNLIQSHEKYFPYNDSFDVQSPERHMEFHRDDHFHSPDQFHTPENVVSYRNFKPRDPRKPVVDTKFNSLKKRRLGLQKPRGGQKQTTRK